MIAYVTVGTDDIERAKRFYGAFLPALGYGLTEGPEGLSFTLAVQQGQPALPDFYVKPTFDGRPASAGNGSMVAFEARSQKQVRALHAAALGAGGVNEGPLGFRDAYGPHFYAVIFATRKATRSRCFRMIRKNRGARRDFNRTLAMRA